MSSFKKRTTTVPISGTKPSPFNSLPLLSTGLAALDDLLGGGLPLSASLLIESDVGTSYADLLFKFWLAQGIECKQDLLVVSSGLECTPTSLIKSLMGVQDAGPVVESDDEAVTAATEKLKIAFRYEGMKQHAVEVPQPSPTAARNEVYCSNFDLTSIMPIRSSDLTRCHLIDVVDHLDDDKDLYDALYDRIAKFIDDKGYALPTTTTQPRKALRIALHSLGSPSWGPTNPHSLYRFLSRLRTLLRRSSASALVTFPAHLYRLTSPSLVHRLEHTTDGVIEVQSFASSPLLLASFPRHNGLLRIPKLPSLGSLIAPSAKLSVLRGLGGGGGGEGGAGLDLGFRIKRRRFIIEPLRDDSGIGAEPVKAAVPVKEKEVVKEEAVERSTTVRFAGEELGPAPKARKPPSVSTLLHKSPELYEF